MNIRLSSPIQTDSVVDGEGIRTVIWTQGCSHNCKGCHNPETHDFNKGFLKPVNELINEIRNLEFQDGVTLSGGDPFMQVDAVLEIAKFCKSINLNVWCYTGFTFDNLLLMSKTNSNVLELLKNIDVLIDGKFILEEKSYALKFRGSKNQRIIDVKKSLVQEKVVLVLEYNKEVNISNKEYLFI